MANEKICLTPLFWGDDGILVDDAQRDYRIDMHTTFAIC